MSEKTWLILVVLFVIWLHWMIWAEYRDRFWSGVATRLRRVGQRMRDPWAEERALMDALHQQVEALRQEKQTDR